MRHLKWYPTREQYEKDGRQNPPFVGFIKDEGAVKYNGEVGLASLPLYIEALEDLMIQFTRNNIEYSIDREVWDVLSPNTLQSFSAGTRVFFRCTSPQEYTDGIGKFIVRTQNTSEFIEAKFNAGGNVASMAYGDDYLKYDAVPYSMKGMFSGSSIISAKYMYCPAGFYNQFFLGCESLIEPPNIPATTLVQSCYYAMFQDCTSLVNAPALPATTLADYCYGNMFQGCTSLVNAPELPATTLAGHCYESMFRDCTSLVNAPALPATTLAGHCYRSMFSRCTSLVNAPALPATTLVDYCYGFMFSRCTSLVNAPALPATTLARYCCYNMFQGCTSLVNAPELLAAILADDCYNSMFSGCTSLNYIKMTSIEVGGLSLYNWVEGVASSGTFVKAAGVYLPTGTSGIPSGWTIEEVAV